MGFFSDLKEDLSQAVNELMPVSDKAADVPEESDMEPGTESQSAEEVSLEAMLENIDEIALTTDLGSEEAEPEVPEEMEFDGEPEVAEPQISVEFGVIEETFDEAETEVMEELPEAEQEPELMYEMIPEEPEPEAEEPAVTQETEVPVAWELRREIEQKKGEKENKGAEKKMDSMAGRQASDETAVITAGMEINGDINSEGSIDLVGTVSGNIDILGKLNVTGHINGNSKAAEIYAEGAKINGEVVSEGAVKIGASSVIIGNITATSAAIAGAVKGDIDVKGPVILDASAIVMGNIKSKSVQINNGAVIEGMCSQCYADVSPTSFFDEYKPETKSSKKSK